MKAVAVLIQEHRTIKKMIALLKVISKDLEKIKRLQPEFYHRVIDFFHVYVDVCHHGKEEKVLFQRLEEKPMAEKDRTLMKQLIEEHKLARKLLKELSELSQSKEYKKIAEQFEKMIHLYEQHIDKENNKFFLPAFAYFSDEETKSIVKEFEEVDKKMIHEKYLQVVQDLESLIGIKDE
jgi:hemerythrin-like domain-containing protein